MQPIDKGFVEQTRQLLQEKVEQAVEVNESERRSNPVSELRRRFDNLRAFREPFLQEARYMAELILPGMYNGTPTDPLQAASYLFGQEKFDTANQSLIAQGTLLLSWTMANVVLPADGDYFSRNIEQSIAAQMQQLEDMRKQMNQQMGQMGGQQDGDSFTPISIQVNQELLRDDKIIQKHTASSNHQEVLARCFFHSLISGVSVFGHLTLSEAKAYTIQNSICVFDSAHEPVEVIVVDRMPMVSLPESVQKKLVGTIPGDQLSNLDPTQHFVTIYTQQLRTGVDTLSLRTEIEGIPISELSFDLPADAPALIPLPFMFMNEADPYPIGWLTFNRGDCFSYENLSLSMEAMISVAASVILGLPPGSRVTSEEIRETPGLSVIATADAKARLEMIVAPIAQNLQQVLGVHDKKERSLQMIFGMDFAVQRPGERVTAEEIQVMSAGLQKLFGATYKQTERTFQQRHCKRQFFLAEDQKLVRPIDKKTYTLSLTAGLQAMEAQNEINKMDQMLARSGQFGPQGITAWSRDNTLQWYASKMKLDISDKFLTPQQQAEQAGMGQLLSAVQAAGPQAPAIVAQIMMQMMSGKMGSPATGQLPGPDPTNTNVPAA